MQVLLLAIIISVCIFVPPIGSIVLVLIGIGVIVAIVQAIKDRNKKSAEHSSKNKVVTAGRESMKDDWILLTASAVVTIKQHWNTLEKKFEEHIDEDDYGIEYIDSRFSTEINYFTHKVVLPKLKELPNVRADSISLLPYPPVSLGDLYAIKHEDSADVIADKYISGLLQDERGFQIDDDILYAIYNSDPETVSIENSADDPHDTSKFVELKMGGKLQPNRPMRVTHLAGIVYILFYAMYSSREAGSKSKKSLFEDFIGNDPYRYEEYIRKLLLSDGFSAKRTKGSGDYGVDVIASKDGVSYAIQCKLYNHTVGTKSVQEVVSGRIFYRTDHAIVVSDNSFTDAAKRLAHKSDVVLAHHKNLLQKIEQLHEQMSPRHGEGGQGPSKSGQDRSASVVTKHKSSAKREFTDTDELITVTLPTINSDK